jgi:hypothetical protein
MFDAQLKKDLMTAAQFTEDDLIANRNGILTEAQQEKLKKTVGMTRIATLVMIPIFILIIAGIIGYVFFYSPSGAAILGSFSKNPETLYIVGGVLGVVILIIFLSFLRTLVGSNKLTAATLNVVEGNAKLKSSRDGEYGFTSYILKIDKVKFHVTEAVFKTLVEDGNYRIYYVKNSPAHMILSIDTL